MGGVRTIHSNNLASQVRYLMAPNYQGGRDVLAGFKRTFKGKIIGEVYTPLSQLDYAAELAQLRAVKPAAVFAFYPGGLGIQFVQQYSQAGLKSSIPLYTAFTVDNTSLPGLGDAALDVNFTTFWNTRSDNPANKRFVDDFVKKYQYEPSEYAAQQYDAMRLLDAAIKAAGGIDNKPVLLAAIKAASFSSVRGNFKFNTNQFPIQDYYQGKVVRGAAGKPVLQVERKVSTAQPDSYVGRCAMK